MSQLSPSIQQVDRTYALFRGKRYSYFGGCDYFRLASHPKVLEAVREGVRKYGLNVASSRTTTGNHQLYERLENDLADFFDAESALLVSSGYVTNLVVAQAQAGDFSHALIDERSHGSLADAATFLSCPVVPFKHRDPQEVSRAIKRLGRNARLILLTDGMSSYDGSVAPLRAYSKQLPRDAWLLVDDAHGAGVLGNTGKGAVELEGVSRRRLVQTMTLSKAFGVYGGAILCPRRMHDMIIARSRLFVGNTPLPLPLAHAAIVAARILKHDKRLRPRLFRNIAYVKEALRRAGLSLLTNPGPIVPVLRTRRGESETLKRHLLAAGILPPFIKYPGAPKEGYFRFVISSEHTRKQLDSLADVFTEHQRRGGS